MKGFKVTNINFHQSMNIPAGTYTYSCVAAPVGSSITFRVGILDFVIDNLAPGVLQKGLKKTFTIESDQVNFYPSRTINDVIFEPQLEPGTIATPAGPNLLDLSEEIEKAGLKITTEMAQLYATKEEMNSSITVEAGKITQKVEDVGGRVSTVEQTVNGWGSTVMEAGQIASQILQEDGTVKITGEKIDLTGSETASGKFIVDVNGKLKTKEAEIEGKIMSSSSGNRVIIDPDDKSVKLIDSNDETLSNIGFKEVIEGSQTFNQPYIEQLSPAVYSFTPKSFFRPSYIELTNVTGFQNTSFVFDAKNSQIILGLSGSSPGTLKINIKNLPTSDSELSAGDLYRDSSGYLKIV